MTTIRGSPVAETAPWGPAGRGEDLAVEEVDGRAPCHQHEGQEDRHPPQGRRVLDEDVQIELDAADHEEDRDEEAEPDGLELCPDGRDLSAGREQPDHDAGGKRPEQDVEA